MTNATELLRRALDALEWCDEECCDEPLEKAIRTFLAAEPEAEPLNAAILPNGARATNVYEAYEEGLKEGKAEPSRKPMTDEEIEKGMDVNALSHLEACAFASGIRFAEKHHQIGINKSDPDSIDLQSRCRGDKL